MPLASAADSAIEQLYREQHAFVWRNLRRLGCADEWVDDAVQEVFLVAARRLSELTPESNRRGWLFAIAYRVVQRMHRDRARYRARLRQYAETRLDEQAPSHEESSQVARQLRRLLGQLDDAKRVVVILMELEGMTSAEVAAIVSAPQGTIDSRLRAARKELKRLLEVEQVATRGAEP